MKIEKINQMNTNGILGLVGLSTAVLLSSCASNDELFAKYDKSCDLPKGNVIEKVRYVDRVKTVHIPTVGATGMSWEPAVYFGFDLDALDIAEQQRLTSDIKILNNNKELKVSVQAFTDLKGSTSYNHQLAKKRQKTVVDHLVNSGIADHRILKSPLGEGLPILGHSTQERSINRRVELMLLDERGRPLALEVQPKQSTFVAPMPVM